MILSRLEKKYHFNQLVGVVGVGFCSWLLTWMRGKRNAPACFGSFMAMVGGWVVAASQHAPRF